MGNFVAIDLGASGTRYTSDSGKISLLANNMVFTDVNKVIDMEPYDNNIESALEVIINKEGGFKLNDEVIFPTKVLIGSMAERYSASNERPSVLRHKFEQKVNYVSGIVAAAISRLTSNVEEDIELYIALPPTEIKTAKKIISENFIGKYTVEFPKYLGGATVNVNIVGVNCYEESFMAMVSYFFTMQGTPREEAQEFMSGNVLSIDIGASTTDVAIIKNGRYLDKSGQTFKTGGNVARDQLIDYIVRDYGFDLPVADAERTMAEGRLQLGNTYEVIGNLITDAKKILAQQIVEPMQSYFRRIGVPIQTVRGIVVSGGGSMQSQYVNDKSEIVKTSEPISYFITQELQTICPGVAVVPYGDDARLANVRGLFIRAKVSQVAKKRAAEQQTSVN